MSPRFLLIFLLLFIAFTSCVPVKQSQKSLITANNTDTAISTDLAEYSGLTNSELVLEACGNIELSFIKKEIVNKNDPILIAPIEIPADTEQEGFPIHKPKSGELLIEDALTVILSEKGHSTIERDMNILTRLYHEAGEDYLISLGPNFDLAKMIDEITAIVLAEKEGSDERDAEFFLDKVIGTYMATNSIYVRNPFHGGKPLQGYIDFKSAAWILSFRVIEFGIRTKPSTELFKGKFKQIERVAVAKVHLRLTNNKGVTQWSSIAEGTASETTPIQAMQSLTSPDFESNWFANSKNMSQHALQQEEKQTTFGKIKSLVKSKLNSKNKKTTENESPK